MASNGQPPTHAADCPAVEGSLPARHDGDGPSFRVRNMAPMPMPMRLGFGARRGTSSSSSSSSATGTTVPDPFEQPQSPAYTPTGAPLRLAALRNQTQQSGRSRAVVQRQRRAHQHGQHRQQRQRLHCPCAALGGGDSTLLLPLCGSLARTAVQNLLQGRGQIPCVYEELRRLITTGAGHAATQQQPPLPQLPHWHEGAASGSGGAGRGEGAGQRVVGGGRQGQQPGGPGVAGAAAGGGGGGGGAPRPGGRRRLRSRSERRLQAYIGALEPLLRSLGELLLGPAACYRHRGASATADTATTRPGAACGGSPPERHRPRRLLVVFGTTLSSPREVYELCFNLSGVGAGGGADDDADSCGAPPASSRSGSASKTIRAATRQLLRLLTLQVQPCAELPPTKLWLLLEAEAEVAATADPALWVVKHGWVAAAAGGAQAKLLSKAHTVCHISIGMAAAASTAGAASAPAAVAAAAVTTAVTTGGGGGGGSSAGELRYGGGGGGGAGVGGSEAASAACASASGCGDRGRRVWLQNRALLPAISSADLSGMQISSQD
jgi:hypothetical protein